MAKSFTSALVGIAIDEGLIEGVDVSMAQYIPSWAGTEKEAIRLRDVLQMTTGLRWTESYDTDELLAPLSSDVVFLTIFGGLELDYAAGMPADALPGKVFNYSSGTSMLLSAVIQKATGKTAAEYAQEKLFGPLGMRRVEWWKSTDGHTLTFCCIDTTSRDFARFGLLYARGGVWAGKQLVSPGWIASSLAPSPARRNYGYQWWLLGQEGQEGPPDRTPPTPSTLPPDTFAAIGLDEELIYVVPHLDLVVVRNGRYIKFDGPPIADPDLLACYPPMGLDSELGTVGPDSWNNGEFLQLVLDAVK
jgi:CubicO group peptidase (beta-lactamase class C family)